MSFPDILLASVCLIALIYGGSCAVATIWAAFSRPAGRRREDPKPAPETLEQDEANPARPGSSTTRLS